MPEHSMKICWLHLVWSTKARFPYFQDEKKAIGCLDILKEICTVKKIYFKVGYVNPEHVHILVDLPVDMTIDTMLQNIKGVSSHEINSRDMFKAKFSWARGYGAFSVSEGNVNTVIRYIQNQKKHHQKMSFREEWELFEKKYWETVKTVMV